MGTKYNKSLKRTNNSWLFTPSSSILANHYLPLSEALSVYQGRFMYPKIPLPTDNIYKFYALFGLLILFASMFSFVSLYNTHLEIAFEVTEELEILKSLEMPTDSQKVRIDILQKKSEVYPSNKKFFLKVIGSCFAVSICLMLYGFGRWHFKIQPEQDLLMKMQLEKIEVEIKMLNNNKRFRAFR